jgi:hypothetical protein
MSSATVARAAERHARQYRDNLLCVPKISFCRTDPPFEPSLRQYRSRLSGNAILRSRDKAAETAPEIQSRDRRDKMRARIPASSGLFATSREISVCTRLRGGAGRTRTSNQAVISR